MGLPGVTIDPHPMPRLAGEQGHRLVDAMRMQVVTPSDHVELLDLPIEQPLASWHDPRVSSRTDGTHRHIVRYAELGGSLFVIKELPDHLAMREYRILRHLADEGIPSVVAVAFATDRGEPNNGEGLLVTRHLDFSLPYKTLFTGREAIPQLHVKMLDSLVGLLVRGHVAGFFWGDCSLSNTLFRRDAGLLSAYVVDVETGEVHDKLSDGQRAHDVTIAQENLAGGLFDLLASGRLRDVDPIAIADLLAERYEQLWSEVTSSEVFRGDERYRIDQRIRRIHDLGFDIAELEVLSTQEGNRVRLTPRVVENSYWAPRLAALTGLRTQENQARRLLNDIDQFRAWQATTVPMPDGLAAARWLEQIFEPTIAAIPVELRGKLEPAELYHQVLEHRWFLSEARGFDVGLGEAVRSYVNNVLLFAPDERVVHDQPTTQVPIIGLTVEPVSATAD